VFSVIFSGLYCILRKRNIIKIIIGLIILNMPLIYSRAIRIPVEGRVPIYSPDQEIVNMVDPIPQALVLTSIVIGLR